MLVKLEVCGTHIHGSFGGTAVLRLQTTVPTVPHSVPRGQLLFWDSNMLERLSSHLSSSEPKPNNHRVDRFSSHKQTWKFLEQKRKKVQWVWFANVCQGNIIPSLSFPQFSPPDFFPLQGRPKFHPRAKYCEASSSPLMSINFDNLMTSLRVMESSWHLAPGDLCGRECNLCLRLLPVHMQSHHQS